MVKKLMGTATKVGTSKKNKEVSLLKQLVKE